MPRNQVVADMGPLSPNGVWKGKRQVRSATASVPGIGWQVAREDHMNVAARSLAPFAVATLVMGVAPSAAAADPAPGSQRVVITSTARVLESHSNGTATVTGT